MSSGPKRMAQTLGEKAIEVALEAAAGDHEAVVRESAELPLSACCHLGCNEDFPERGLAGNGSARGDDRPRRKAPPNQPEARCEFAATPEAQRPRSSRQRVRITCAGMKRGQIAFPAFGIACPWE
jgi:hypothetical protein